MGVMLPCGLVRSSGAMQIAKSPGTAPYQVTTVFPNQRNRTCPACDIAPYAGLRVVLIVRNSCPAPTAPLRGLTVYQRTLDQVLVRYRTVVLAVEKEENWALFYTGTPEDCAAGLQAACQVAHQQRVCCTSGGLLTAW